jgi:hypothetical protein
MYFSNLNRCNKIKWQKVCASAQPLSHDHLGGLVSRKAAVHAPCRGLISAVQSIGPLPASGYTSYFVDIIHG